MENYFKELLDINVNSHVETKNGLKYCSWPFAWAEVKKKHPTATYTIYENADGWNYFTDGRTAWVKTGVTVNDIEHIEYLPILDYKNKSITLDKITSFDVNKAIQRSLTKAVARHGLGLYIYAGEDLPQDLATTDEKIAECRKRVNEKTPPPISKEEEFIYYDIKACKTVEELEDKYKLYEKQVSDKEQFIDFCKGRKKEILEVAE